MMPSQRPLVIACQVDLNLLRARAARIAGKPAARLDTLHAVLRYRPDVATYVSKLMALIQPDADAV